MEETEKKCVKCGEVFPFTNDYFNYENKKENILSNRCKKCHRYANKKVLDNKENKTELIQFKVTIKDKEKIKKNAERMGVDMAKYLRYVAIKNQPIIIKDLVELEPIEKTFGNIEYQVKRLGVNVNQISKNLNEGGNVSEATIISLINVLEKLNLKMEEIEKVIAKGYENLD